MTSESTDRDAKLKKALGVLAGRKLVPVWSAASAPRSALVEECRRLRASGGFEQELTDYLRSRTIIRRALQMFFTHISMAARANWEDGPPEFRGVMARGWFLGRWLPTFLIIDGPNCRFLTAAPSPLASRLGPNFPLLADARDLIDDRQFRLLRNGFAHWGFDWEVVQNDSYIVAYDWERDLPIAKLHQAEADAFHLAAFALIDAVNEAFIAR